MLARGPAPLLPHKHGRHRKVTVRGSREAANYRAGARPGTDGRKGWRQQRGRWLPGPDSKRSFLIRKCMRSRFLQEYELRLGMSACDVPFLLSCMNESKTEGAGPAPRTGIHSCLKD